MRAISLAGAAVLLALLCWAGAAAADVAVPPLTGRVVDQTGTLSPGDIAALNQTLRALETRKGSQIAVLIVPTTQPETIEQFSIRVAETWKIGRKKIDDGALLVIAKNDRHLRIEVGYGLEGALTDATARRIIDEDITPRFKAGDFAGGVTAGINRMIGVINGEKLPAPEPEHWQTPSGFDYVSPANPFLIFVVIVFAAFLRSALGRLVGSVATGGFVGVLAYFIAGSIAAAILFGAIAFAITMVAGGFGPVQPMPGVRNRRGDWGGSYSGGWSGGGGGGSSDWSSSGSSDSGGGGGSFGGGGASGSW